jgi:hypothetical protein
MIDDTSSQEAATRPLRSSFDRYLQDRGKGQGGDGGNYRRNTARERDRFAEWAAGERGDEDWTGITPQDADRDPTFADLDERVFREYARHRSGDRGLKQNTVQTCYAYISAWCSWCVNEGYLEAHYAQRASAAVPLPETGGSRATSRIGSLSNVTRSPGTSTSRRVSPSGHTTPFTMTWTHSTGNEPGTRR